MKINKFLLGAFALSVGFASCSNEEPIKGNDVAQADETRFMSVQISAPAQTSRAFEDGAAVESQIDHLDFLFFDKNGNPTGTTLRVKGDELTTVDGPFENGNVTKIGTSVVSIQLNQGDNLPAQVICVVNGATTLVDKMKGNSIDDLRNVVNTAGTFSDDAVMTMTNSMYFGTDPITGEKLQRVVASPVRSSQLYATEDEAQKALDKAIAAGATEEDQSVLVNVYVERVAAKVGLNLPSTREEDGKPTIETLTLAKGGDVEGNVTVKFVPEFWFMNATSKENFPIKRYGLSVGDNGIMDQPKYDDINSRFAGTKMATTWNSPENHRSYWGCSPSYYENDYPVVSDQVNDLLGNTKDYSSKYYSYNEVKAANGVFPARQAIAATNGSFATVAGQTTGYIYTNETTASIGVITSASADANPAAAVASAVIVGHYEVTDGEGAATKKTFYVDRNDGDKYYANAEDATKALAARQTLLRANADGTGTLDASAFVLEHPKKAVRDLLTNPYIAGRLVTIQLAAIPEGGAYIWNGSAYEAITDLDKINAQLVSVGYMDMFADGLAFYSIPVRHLGFREESYENGKYLWSDMQLGELGLVRNHVYTINVTKIGGLGTGLRSADQPILPARELYNQYVAVRLNVLAWNVVPSWKVEL